AEPATGTTDAVIHAPSPQSTSAYGEPSGLGDARNRARATGRVNHPFQPSGTPADALSPAGGVVKAGAASATQTRTEPESVAAGSCSPCGSGTPGSVRSVAVTVSRNRPGRW